MAGSWLKSKLLVEEKGMAVDNKGQIKIMVFSSLEFEFSLILLIFIFS